jgi:hypothetical protein
MENETALVYITCKQPILMTDESEHDRCYAERFARQFPFAQKADV